MHQRLIRVRNIFIILLIVQLVVLCVFQFVLKQNVIIAWIIALTEAIAFFIGFDMFDRSYKEQSMDVESSLGKVVKDTYLAGGMGLVIYDDDYVITHMSELFDERHLRRIDHKLLEWLPEVDELIAGNVDAVNVRLDDKMYRITRLEDEPVLVFQDITQLDDYRQRVEVERLVAGVGSFDNYEESTQYEDEADRAKINSTLRSTMNEYCAEFGIVNKRITSSRYAFILNEKIFNDMAMDHFSILTKVRKAAQQLDVPITLSMGFARGDASLTELDEMASNLLDLAQTRGGDQVAVQTYGEDVKYYGGSSEAQEKRSRVRVRVMSHSFHDLIQRSSNVIICGHKEADFDCLGSAMCIAKICEALHKESVVIAKTGGVEEKLQIALDEYEEELKKEINFVTETEALNHLQDNSLVIMTDHHNLKQSNGAKVLDQAKQIVVIDHHRRATDMGVKPVLVYIEAGASSTCEILTEMLPYVSQRIDVGDLVATFMLAGMIIDTQRWRVRTGSRTYEAASTLRQMGADPQLAYDFLKDTFDEFSLKSAVMSASERYDHGVVIVPFTEQSISRTMISQVADDLLSIQGVQAAFVIADTGSDTNISARSDGTINVQRIMEKLGGGGHLTSSAVQRDDRNVIEMKQELLAAIEEYFKEDTDESHT